MESLSHGRRHDGRSDDFQRRDRPTDPTIDSDGRRHLPFRGPSARRKELPADNPPATASRRSEPLEAGTGHQGPAIAGGGWKPRAGSAAGGAAPKPTDYFNQPLNQTLGYLNQPFGPARPPSPAGDPQYPFPWLNWSYRPFNNEYELLQVPTLSSSRLLARNTLDPGTTSATWTAACARPATCDGYDSAAAVYDGAAQQPGSLSAPLEFLRVGDNRANAGLAAQLHRLLAYVGVPSRFANAQLQMLAELAATTTRQHYFHTPFNRISRYREPGRINLNTVTSPDVLFGAMNMYFSPLQQNSQLNPVFWDKFVRSRRGDGRAAR